MAAGELTPAPRPARAVPGTPVFMYHVVKEGSGVGPADKYTVSPDQLRAHLGLVARHGFRLARLGEVWSQPEAARSTPTAAITFDDGEESHYARAFPVLGEAGGRADFFVNTATVGRPGFLSWSQIAEMQRAGHAFHSHSHDHVVLLGLGAAALRRQLRESKDVLEDRLGVPVQFLAAPYGLLNRRVVDVAREVGYRAVCTSASWPARPGAATVSRMAIYPSTSADEFVELLRGRPGILVRRMARALAVSVPKRVVLRIQPRWLGVQVLEAGR
ncbi:MAG TPA: polysaccharide deacetylase family protein [Methylomirabilota bacterium]|nr:polysaccharide deacetylase family protein [Methylomirabilota bacterium]